MSGNRFSMPPLSDTEMVAFLRSQFDSEMHRMHSRLDLLCERWGIPQHSGSIAAYKLAEPYIDDWFPSGERREPLVSEVVLHELFAFVDRFCREYQFEMVTPERLASVSDVVLGTPRLVDGEMTLGEGFAWPEGPRPANWFRWVGVQFRLYTVPDRVALRRDIRQLAIWWGDDPDNDRELTRRLYMVVETVIWGLRQAEANP